MFILLSEFFSFRSGSAPLRRCKISFQSADRFLPDKVMNNIANIPRGIKYLHKPLTIHGHVSPTQLTWFAWFFQSLQVLAACSRYVKKAHRISSNLRTSQWITNCRIWRDSRLKCLNFKGIFILQQKCLRYLLPSTCSTTYSKAEHFVCIKHE